MALVRTFRGQSYRQPGAWHKYAGTVGAMFGLPSPAQWTLVVYTVSRVRVWNSYAPEIRNSLIVDKWSEGKRVGQSTRVNVGVKRGRFVEVETLFPENCTVRFEGNSKQASIYDAALSRGEVNALFNAGPHVDAYEGSSRIFYAAGISGASIEYGPRSSHRETALDSNAIRSLSLAGDGKRVAALQSSEIVSVWDWQGTSWERAGTNVVRGGTPSHLGGRSEALQRMAMSKDGGRIAVGVHPEEPFGAHGQRALFPTRLATLGPP